MLSGAAAIIVLLGVLASMVGIVYRRVAKARLPDTAAKETSQIILKDLSAPAPYPIQFANSDGLRIAYAVQGSGTHDVVMAPGIISHLNIMSHMPPIRDTVEAVASFARVLCFDKRGQVFIAEYPVSVSGDTFCWRSRRTNPAGPNCRRGTPKRGVS